MQKRPNLVPIAFGIELAILGVFCMLPFHGFEAYAYVGDWETFYRICQKTSSLGSSVVCFGLTFVLLQLRPKPRSAFACFSELLAYAMWVGAFTDLYNWKTMLRLAATFNWYSADTKPYKTLVAADFLLGLMFLIFSIILDRQQGKLKASAL